MLPSTTAALVCRIGTRLCALPIAHVVEIMRPLALQPVLAMPAFVAGVAIVRGAPTPVLDAAALVGAPSSRPHGRFVTLRVGDRRAVLAVDDVLGVREVALGSLEPLPPLLREANAGVAEQIGVLDAELVLVLNTARIVAESILEALARPEPAKERRSETG